MRHNTYFDYEIVHIVLVSIINIVKMTQLSAVILAGGKSRRFRKQTNQSKFEYIVNKSPLIINQINKLLEITDDILISVKSSNQISKINYILKKFQMENLVNFILDDTSLIHLKGPYLGIISSLSKLKYSKFILYSPIDYPFVRISDYQLLIDTCQENRVELASYSLPENKISSSLFCMNTQNILNKLKLMQNSPDSRLSGIFRGSYSTALIEIEEINHQFLNMNLPLRNPSINYADPVRLHIIKPNHTYWLFIKSLQEGTQKNPCQYLLKEIELWDQVYILNHIKNDIEKYCNT